MRNALRFAIASAVLFSGAALASDPASILHAHKIASGGDAWNGKAVLKTQATLTGQGLTGTDTSIGDLSDGRNVDRYTLGPASGASGYDGRQVWEQDPSGTVNIESGGDALPLAINAAYRN